MLQCPKQVANFSLDTKVLDVKFDSRVLKHLTKQLRGSAIVLLIQAVSSPSRIAFQKKYAVPPYSADIIPLQSASGRRSMGMMLIQVS